MAIKKSRKKEEASVEEVSLQQIAQEMNSVMQYGFDDETGETNEAEQIDLELSDKALQKEILKRAEEDLQPADEDAFSPEVWEWFINNGITPTNGEVQEVADDPDHPEGFPHGDAGEVEDAEDDGGEAEVEEEENVPAEKPAKDKGKKDVKEKPLKKQTAPEKRVPKERGPSNEQIAIDAVKEGKTEKDLLKIYTKIYEAKGKDDPEYISRRTVIYYNIACKQLGKPCNDKVCDSEKEMKKELKKLDTPTKEKEAPKAKPKLKKK